MGPRALEPEGRVMGIVGDDGRRERMAAEARVRRGDADSAEGDLGVIECIAR